MNFWLGDSYERIYYDFNINWYGLGHHNQQQWGKMLENIVSIGLTTMCGVFALLVLFNGLGE